MADPAISPTASLNTGSRLQAEPAAADPAVSLAAQFQLQTGVRLLADVAGGLVEKLVALLRTVLAPKAVDPGGGGVWRGPTRQPRMLRAWRILSAPVASAWASAIARVAGAMGWSTGRAILSMIMQPERRPDTAFGTATASSILPSKEERLGTVSTGSYVMNMPMLWDYQPSSMRPTSILPAGRRVPVAARLVYLPSTEVTTRIATRHTEVNQQEDEAVLLAIP